MTEIGLSFNKLRYIRTIHFKNKISNEPCQYQSTACLVGLVVHQRRYPPSDSDENIDLYLSIHGVFPK